MNKPCVRVLLEQLAVLETWCNKYKEQHPQNHGTYSASPIRELYKPLRDGVVFYSSGHGWMLRKNWQESIRTKRAELEDEALKGGEA